MLVAGCAMLAVGAAAALTDDQPWVPASEIQTAEGARVVGYVLDESVDEIVILTHDDREIVRLVPHVVRGRHLCATTSGLGRRTIVQILSGESPTTPRCSG